MIVVSDASALIALARIGRLDLLRQLTAQVRIPEAVYREVSQAGRGRPGSGEMSGAAWILRSAVSDRAAVARLRDRLGEGEAEVIALARELPADLVILDDATARRVAEAEGLKVVGLLGLLLHAKERRLVGTLRPIVDEMVAAGFFLGESMYRAVLRRAGEELASRDP